MGSPLLVGLISLSRRWTRKRRHWMGREVVWIRVSICMRLYRELCYSTLDLVFLSVDGICWQTPHGLLSPHSKLPPEANQSFAQPPQPDGSRPESIMNVASSMSLIPSHTFSLSRVSLTSDMTKSALLKDRPDTP